MPPIGSERKGRIPQAAQIAHGLSVCWTAKARIFQDRFFELGISDLTVRRRCIGDDEWGQQSDSV